MVTVRYREIDLSFNPVFRVYISGSSESGKTYFAESLLRKKIFKYTRIYYFHPDFHEDNSTNWDKTLDVPVIFSAEFPDVEAFLEMPEYSCIVFDDLINQCVASKTIDYLLRVLSGKRKLHVMIMTQRYFVHAKFAISIRNSSNYHVLMRNSDMSNVNQIARTLGLKQKIAAANNFNSEKEYPYIFIDRTNKARSRKTEVFIDILSPILELIRGSMKFYLFSEMDFKKTYKIRDCELADYEKTREEKTRVDHKSSQAAWNERKRFENRIRRAIRKFAKH